MANYRMLQQEADDYAKVMGEYVAAVEDYNAQAQAFNALPYVVSAKTVRNDSYERNIYNLSDGKDVESVGGANIGDRVMVSSREEVVPASGEYVGAKPTTRTEYVATKAPVPTLSATEPKELSFTRAEAAALQNPPQSLASAAAQTLSAIERLKEATGAKWSPYQGGLDSNKGILAKVLSGKV